MNRNQPIEALQCLAVTKRYGQLGVLHHFDLTVGAGSAVCLQGPNGAGKSTLMRCCVGIEPVDNGDILVAGQSIVRRPVEAKRLLGYAADEPYLYPYLTAVEHLRLWTSLRGGLESWVERGVAIAGEMALGPVLDRQVRTYSRGMRQQLGFLGAVFHDPDLVVLDEPFTATDADSTAAALDYLGGMLGQGRAILFSTHDLTLAGPLAARRIRLEATQPSQATADHG